MLRTLASLPSESGGVLKHEMSLAAQVKSRLRQRVLHDCTQSLVKLSVIVVVIVGCAGN